MVRILGTIRLALNNQLMNTKCITQGCRKSVIKSLWKSCPFTKLHQIKRGFHPSHIGRPGSLNSAMAPRTQHRVIRRSRLVRTSTTDYDRCQKLYNQFFIPWPVSSEFVNTRIYSPRNLIFQQQAPTCISTYLFITTV